MSNLFISNNQLINQTSSLESCSTPAIGSLNGKKVVAIPKDAIKSGSAADIQGFITLFFYLPFGLPFPEKLCQIHSVLH